jgi:hypothetical protein
MHFGKHSCRGIFAKVVNAAFQRLFNINNWPMLSSDHRLRICSAVEYTGCPITVIPLYTFITFHKEQSYQRTSTFYITMNTFIFYIGSNFVEQIQHTEYTISVEVICKFVNIYCITFGTSGDH